MTCGELLYASAETDLPAERSTCISMLSKVALDLVDLGSVKAKSILRYSRPAIHSVLFILFIFFLFSRAYVSVPLLCVRTLSLSAWLTFLFSHALEPHRLMCADFLVNLLCSFLSTICAGLLTMGLHTLHPCWLHSPAPYSLGLITSSLSACFSCCFHSLLSSSSLSLS